MDDLPWRDAAPLPRTRSDRLRALAMPTLLAAIAVLGVYRSATLDQPSWQGASFGMFATYDSRSSRAVIVEVVQAGSRTRIDVPAGLDDDAIRLTVVPTDGHARALAEDVLARLEGDGVTAVEVEVRRLVVDTASRALRIHAEAIARGAAR